MSDIKPSVGRPKKTHEQQVADALELEKEQIVALGKEIATTASKKIWKKQGKEPAVAFKMFEHFMNSTERSVAKTAQAFEMQPAYVFQIYEKWSWEARALAFDKEGINEAIGAVLIEPERITAKDMREAHLKLATMAEEFAAMNLYLINDYMKTILVCKEKGIEPPAPPPTYTPEQIVRMAEMGSKLKRVTVESSPANIETRHMDYSRLTTEDLKRLKELAEKAKTIEE